MVSLEPLDKRVHSGPLGTGETLDLQEMLEHLDHQEPQAQPVSLDCEAVLGQRGQPGHWDNLVQMDKLERQGLRDPLELLALPELQETLDQVDRREILVNLDRKVPGVTREQTAVLELLDLPAHRDNPDKMEM